MQTLVSYKQQQSPLLSYMTALAIQGPRHLYQDPLVKKVKGSS